jgi:perosamine synthetase
MNNIPWLESIYNPVIKKKEIIPIYAPEFTGNEKKYLNNCIDTGWISANGGYVRIFEDEFARYCGSKYAVSVSSGTSALYLALVCLGIKRGDEIIVPSFTMVSTALAVAYIGAKPVFVDCETGTGNINPSEIEKAITKKTKAIIPVHIYGIPAEMDTIQKIADKHSLSVVADAAEAMGAKYKGRMVGSISIISTFSLYVNKIVTSGQGGMITTSSKKLYEELKRLNNYYFSDKKHFWHEKIGYNFKMSNLEAAVGLAQLEKIAQTLTKKKNIYRWYKDELDMLKEIFSTLAIPVNTISNHWHIAYKIVNEKYNVMALRKILGENGIETRSFFIPLHLQPPFYNKNYDGKYLVSEKLVQTGVLLPSSPRLKRQDVARICRVIKSFFKASK